MNTCRSGHYNFQNKMNYLKLVLNIYCFISRATLKQNGWYIGRMTHINILKFLPIKVLTFLSCDVDKMAHTSWEVQLTMFLPHASVQPGVGPHHDVCVVATQGKAVVPRYVVCTHLVLDQVKDFHTWKFTKYNVSVIYLSLKYWY